MYGILTNIEYDKHWIFKNYYYSLQNVFGEENVKRVLSVYDLVDIDVLFIGDEHFLYNKEIWMNDHFINKCNELDVFVFIFNNEKIYNSNFPWNESIQEKVKTFKNYKQFVYDVNDCNTLNTEINKTFMSRYFIDKINFSENKIDKPVFFGKLNDGYNSYNKRKEFLERIKTKIDVDIIESDPSISMMEYMEKISQYKYVLSPLGNGEFVPMRFYESLFVNSIPIQESTPEIKNKFKKEIELGMGIFFENDDDLINQINSQNKLKKINYFMEDFISEKVLPILDKKNKL